MSRGEARLQRCPEAQKRNHNHCAGYRACFGRKDELLMPTYFQQTQKPGSSDAPVANLGGSNERLYFMSRDLRLLAMFIAAVMAVAAGLAWAMRGVDYVEPVVKAPSEEIRLLLASPSPNADALIHSILSLHTAPSKMLTDGIVSSTLPEKAKELALAVCESLRGDPAEPTAELLILAYQVNSLRTANEAIGDLYARLGKVSRAEDYYRRELERNPSEALRAKLISLLARDGDLSALASLFSDPAFSPHFPLELRLKIALHQRDWRLVASEIVKAQIRSISSLPLILALAAGLAWCIVGLHCGQPHSVLGYRTVVPLMAVCVGAAGALVVNFVAAWEDSFLGVSQTGVFLADLGYFAGVVAPREEVLKLVLLLPFLPTLLSRRDPLETLIVCGSIGLGFALEGNLQFCRVTRLEDAFGRLLTANFFHFATTALSGAALCNVLRSGLPKLIPFLRTLAAVIVAHGIYDGFSRIEPVRSLSWISVVSVLVVSKLFFMELRRWRDRFTDQLFLGATVVICLTGLAAAVLVTASIHAGFSVALWSLLKNAPYFVLTGFVFFLRFDHDLNEESPEGTPNL